MTGNHLLLTATIIAAFVAGLVLRLPSCLTECLAPHLGVAEARTRFLRIFFQLLLVPMMVGSGLLIDKWGAQTVLVIGALLTAIAIASIEFTRLYRHVLPAILVL